MDGVLTITAALLTGPRRTSFRRSRPACHGAPLRDEGGGGRGDTRGADRSQCADRGRARLIGGLADEESADDERQRDDRGDQERGLRALRLRRPLRTHRSSTASAVTDDMIVIISAMPAAPATCWTVPSTAEPYE